MTAPALILDIETLPLEAALAAPYPTALRPPPGNYKNADTIAAWRVSDEAEWRRARVKECSLTPRLGRVACFGFREPASAVTTWIASEEANERQLLRDAWQAIIEHELVVTFHGTFDLRFLFIRALVHDLGACEMAHVHGRWRVGDLFKRYTTYPHFDCRAVLTGWDDRMTGTLTDWCAALGIVGCDEDDLPASGVYEAAQRDDWPAIMRHCSADVRRTACLFERLHPMFALRA